ncbi:MAG: hypothetical protein EA398_15775 [Deltaproteobacteria bacterium]|nr:MAG: hypothetical protein EA398_15775 [Deltaproteobacteria bacterium]
MAHPGCDEVFSRLETPATDVDPCLRVAATADVSGEWRLNASGRREDCRDEARDGRVFLEIPEIWEVTQRGAGAVQEATGVVPTSPGSSSKEEGAGLPTHTLTLEGAPGRELGFAGEVRGACVTFSVAEGEGSTTRDRIETTFEGTWDPVGERIVGTWRARGPSACRGEGNFSIIVD